MQPLPSQPSQPSAAATESLIGALGMSIAASGAGGEDGGGAAMSRARFAAALLRAAQDPVVIDQAFAQYQEFVKGQEAEVEVEDEAAVIEQESFAAEEGPETMEVLGLEAEGGAAVGGAPQGEPQAAWPPGAPAQHAAASSAMSPFDALASGRETPATSGCVCVCAQPNRTAGPADIRVEENSAPPAHGTGGTPVGAGATSAPAPAPPPAPADALEQLRAFQAGLPPSLGIGGGGGGGGQQSPNKADLVSQLAAMMGQPPGNR